MFLLFMAILDQCHLHHHPHPHPHPPHSHPHSYSPHQPRGRSAGKEAAAGLAQTHTCILHSVLEIFLIT